MNKSELIPIPNTNNLYWINPKTKDVISTHGGDYNIRKWSNFRDRRIFEILLYLKNKTNFAHRYISMQEVEQIIEGYKMSKINEQYIVCQVTTDNRYWFNKDLPVQHSEDDAIKLCEKLAKLHPGTSYAYFKKIRTCQVSEIAWS
jgi:hypothetical protein